MKTLKWLFWVLLFLILLLGIDQFFVQVPPVHPAHAAVSQFYRDFRTRLFALFSGEEQPSGPTIPPAKTPGTADKPQSIEAVIDQQQSKAPVKAAPLPPRRYLYSDANGELQFADSLDEVPQKYRAQAQPMSE